jgi:hypothetical protein
VLSEIGTSLVDHASADAQTCAGRRELVHHSAHTSSNLLDNSIAVSLSAGLLPSLVLISNPIIQYFLFEQFKNLIKAWKRRRLAVKLHKQKAHQKAAAIADAIVAQNGQTMPDIPECSQVSGTCQPPSKAPAVIEQQAVTCNALETFIASALSKVGYARDNQHPTMLTSNATRILFTNVTTCHLSIFSIAYEAP